MSATSDFNRCSLNVKGVDVDGKECQLAIFFYETHHIRTPVARLRMEAAPCTANLSPVTIALI